MRDKGNEAMAMATATRQKATTGTKDVWVALSTSGTMVFVLPRSPRNRRLTRDQVVDAGSLICLEEWVAATGVDPTAFATPVRVRLTARVIP